MLSVIHYIATQKKINKEIYGMVSGGDAKDKSRKGEWELSGGSNF